MDKISTRGHARFGSGRGVQCYLLIFAQNMQPPSGNLREREPPGTSLKFKKTQTGQVPGAHFLRQIMFPDRSRPFPEVAGAHFLRQIIVPGPFPDVPGALFLQRIGNFLLENGTFRCPKPSKPWRHANFFKNGLAERPQNQHLNPQI